MYATTEIVGTDFLNSSSFAKPKFTGSAFGQTVETQQKLKPGKVITATDVQETNYEKVVMSLRSQYADESKTASRQT